MGRGDRLLYEFRGIVAPEEIALMVQFEFIGHHPVRRFAAGARNVLDVAILVDGLAVFISAQFYA
jgi:hypothetical protein